MARTGLIFRMENENGATVAESAEEVLAVEAEASNATEEVESASGDVTEVATGIEQAGEAQAELSDIEASVEEAAEDGGMTPREAEHVQARLERVAALLGTTVSDMGLTFRKESFGGASSRVAATKMRLEGIKEWGKKIWEAIKKAWAWLKDAVTNFFAKLTGNVEAIEKRLKELQGRVASMGAKQFDKNKSTVSYRAKTFSIEGKTNLDSILALLENGKIYFEIMRDVSSSSAGLKKQTTFAIPNFMDSAKEVEAIVALFAKGKQATGSLPKSAEKDAAGKIRLPDGQAVLAAPKTEVVEGKDFSVFSVQVGDADEKTAEDYDALVPDDMKRILTKALELAKEIKNAKKVETEFRAQIDENIKHAEAMIKISSSENDKKTDETQREATKTKLELARALNGFTINIIKMTLNKFPKAAFDLCAGAGDLVAGNLSNLKEKEK